MKNMIRHRFLFDKWEVPVSKIFLQDKHAGSILFDHILGKEIAKIFGSDCFNFLQEKSQGTTFEVSYDVLTMLYSLTISWKLLPKQYTYAALRWSEVVNSTTEIHI